MPEVETRIDAVTVYTDRARVRRRGRVNLAAGSHELVIKDLPTNVLAESVRAAARSAGRARLLGTDVSRTFHAEPVESKPSELQAQIEPHKAPDELLPDIRHGVPPAKVLGDAVLCQAQRNRHRAFGVQGIVAHQAL